MNKKCKVALKELYGIDMVLSYGFTRRLGFRVPDKFKREIMANLEIEYRADKRYYANLDDVFDYFSSKYPVEIKRRKIFDYQGLLTEAYTNMI